MYFIHCLLAVFAGTLIPLQAGLNAQLRNWLGSPFSATLVSVVISTVCIFVVCVIARTPIPELSSLAKAPWWVWTGGVVGVIYVCMVLTLAPKLGATALVASIIAGQMFISLVLDQFALIGFQSHPINAGRIVGILLLFGGAFLIQKY